MVCREFARIQTSILLCLLFRVVFNEVLQTAKYYMRDVTAVESSWLVELAPHFYKQAKVGQRKLFQLDICVCGCCASSET